MSRHRKTLEHSQLCDTDEQDDDPPFALTDQHIKALELAIRAEGYEILIDPETGEVKLEKARANPARHR